MMMEWLDQILFWHWLILGVVLITLEMLVPGTYFFWMGISALVVGAVMYFMPDLSWLLQVLIFGVLSVISLVLYKSYAKKRPMESDVPALNRRGEQYIGQVFTLEQAIVNGVGKVHIGDSHWKVTGNDMQAGQKVKVVGVDGVILKVEKEG